MATLLQNNCQKRRNRASTTSTSSTESLGKSPAQKKAKKSESDDEVLKALNMAEGLSTKIEIILSKLDKLDSLDSIASSIKNIEDSIGRLDLRTKKLEDFQLSASKDISDLKESFNFIDEKIITNKKAQSQINYLSEQLKKSEDLMAKQGKELEDLKTKDLYLEAYSRRENIKFLHIEEKKDEDVEEVLREFLRDYLDYEDCDTVEFQRLHRNGKGVGSNPRPILARFLRYKDCENILSLGKNLKGTQFQMFPDLPYELIKRRKTLLPVLKKAKQNKIPAAFSKAEPDKLFVRGKLWQAGDELMV